MNLCGVCRYMMSDMWPNFYARRLVIQESFQILWIEFGNTLKNKASRVNQINKNLRLLSQCSFNPPKKIVNFIVISVFNYIDYKVCC